MVWTFRHDFEKTVDVPLEYFSNIYKGLVDEVDKFMRLQADIPTFLNDTYSLEFALRNEKEDLAKLFIRNGADIELRSFRGTAPLMTATECCSLEMVQFMVDHGAMVNTCAVQIHLGTACVKFEHHRSPLEYAICSKGKDAECKARFLLTCGAKDACTLYTKILNGHISRSCVCEGVTELLRNAVVYNGNEETKSLFGPTFRILAKFLAKWLCELGISSHVTDIILGHLSVSGWYGRPTKKRFLLMKNLENLQTPQKKRRLV